MILAIVVCTSVLLTAVSCTQGTQSAQGTEESEQPMAEATENADESTFYAGNITSAEDTDTLIEIPIPDSDSPVIEPPVVEPEDTVPSVTAPSVTETSDTAVADTTPDDTTPEETEDGFNLDFRDFIDGVN